eukprot:tig00000219_g19457.t1
MARRVLGLLALLALAAVASAQLSSIFDASDSGALEKVVLAAQKDDGSFGNAKTTYEAVEALKLLGKPIPKQAQLCSYASGALAKAAGKQAGPAFYAARALAAAGCKGSPAGDEVVKAVAAKLEQAKTLVDLHQAVGAAAALQEAGLAPASTFNIAAAVPKILALMEDDGSFRASESSDSGSAALSAYAFDALAAAARVGAGDKSAIRGALDKMEQLSGLADEVTGESGEKALAFANADKKAPALRATALILSSASQLASALGASAPKVPRTEAAKIADFVLLHKFASNVEEAYLVLSAISAYKAGVPAPLAIRLAETAGVPIDAKDGTVTLLVTDMFGAAAEGAKVTLTKVTPASDSGNVIAENVDLSGAKGEFKFDLLAKKPEPGVYALTLSVAGPAPVKRAVREVKVTTAATIVDFEVDTSDARLDDDVAEHKKVKATYPSAVSAPVAVDADTRLKISYKVKNVATGKPMQPHQSFVTLTSVATGKQVAVLVAKYVDKQYTIVSDVGLLNNEKLRGASGDYAVSVIVGDVVMPRSIVWKAATLAATLRTPENATKKFDLRDVAADRLLTEAQAEIKHQFRAPDRRPSAQFSYLFTALVLVPLLVLLASLGALGVNLSNLPKSGTGSIAALVFIGTLVGMVFVLSSFFFSWTFFPVVKSLIALAVVAVFSGHATLREVAAASRATKAKAA